MKSPFLTQNGKIKKKCHPKVEVTDSKHFNSYRDIISGRTYCISTKLDKSTQVIIDKEEQTLQWYNQTIDRKPMVSEIILQTAFSVLGSLKIVNNKHLSKLLSKIEKREHIVYVHAATLMALLYQCPDILLKYQEAPFNKELAKLYRDTYKGLQKLGLACLLEASQHYIDIDGYVQIERLEQLKIFPRCGPLVDLAPLLNKDLSRVQKDLEHMNDIRNTVNYYWIDTFNEICTHKMFYFARSLLNKTRNPQGDLPQVDVLENVYLNLGLRDLPNKGKHMADETLFKKLVSLCCTPFASALKPGELPEDIRVQNMKNFSQLFSVGQTYGGRQILQYIVDICVLLTIIHEMNRLYITYFQEEPAKEVKAYQFFPKQGYLIKVQSTLFESYAGFPIKRVKGLLTFLEITRGNLYNYMVGPFQGQLSNIIDRLKNK